MICYDSFSGRMFIEDPDDIREKMAKVNDSLLKETSLKDFLKVAEPEHGHFKTNSRRIRMLNRKH